MPTVQYDVSLIPWQSPVVYQGNEGSCGGCLTENALSLVTNLDGQPFTVNAQIAYNMNLATNGWLGVDAGVFPKQMMALLETQGVTQSHDVAYGLQSIGIAPSAADYADAATHTINNFASLPVDGVQENVLAHQIAQALLQGKPLFQAFNVTSSMEAETGPLTQQNGDDTGPSLGGHFAEVVAINTATNMETLATWGSQYGDHGYFQVSLNSFYNNVGGDALNLQGIYYVNGFNGVDLTQNATTAQVAAAFVGLLDRAPALAGMQFYAAAMSAGTSLAAVCDNVIGSAEGAALFGQASDAQFINDVFENVLGRAVAASGAAYYGSELIGGQTRGQVAAEIINATMLPGDWQNGFYFGDGSLSNFPGWPAANPDPNMYSESLLFNNKIQTAEDFAITLQAGAGHNTVAHAAVTATTADPGSIWGVALVGAPEQLGHAHITPTIV